MPNIRSHNIFWFISLTFLVGVLSISADVILILRVEQILASLLLELTVEKVNSVGIKRLRMKVHDIVMLFSNHIRYNLGVSRIQIKGLLDIGTDIIKSACDEENRDFDASQHSGFDIRHTGIKSRDCF